MKHGYNNKFEGKTTKIVKSYTNNKNDQNNRKNNLRHRPRIQKMRQTWTFVMRVFAGLNVPFSTYVIVIIIILI